MLEVKTTVLRKNNMSSSRRRRKREGRRWPPSGPPWREMAVSWPTLSPVHAFPLRVGALPPSGLAAVPWRGASAEGPSRSFAGRWRPTRMPPPSLFLSLLLKFWFYSRLIRSRVRACKTENFSIFSLILSRYNIYLN
jgi:hypothetical protein